MPRGSVLQGADWCIRYCKEREVFCCDSCVLQIITALLSCLILFPPLWQLMLCGWCLIAPWGLGNRWSTCEGCVVAEGGCVVVGVFCHWDYMFSATCSNLPAHFRKVAGCPFTWTCATSPRVTKGLCLRPRVSHSCYGWFGSDQNTIVSHICPVLNRFTEMAQEIKLHEYAETPCIWGHILPAFRLCLMYIIYFACLSVQGREGISVKHFVFPFLWLHWRQRHARGTHTLLCISTAVHQSESHSQLIEALCNLGNVQLLVIFSPSST